MKVWWVRAVGAVGSFPLFSWEQTAEAIQGRHNCSLDCFASLAMTILTSASSQGNGFYSNPDSSSSACSINSSLPTTSRRGTRKIIVDAQDIDRITMAAWSTTRVANGPPSQAPICQNIEPIHLSKT